MPFDSCQKGMIKMAADLTKPSAITAAPHPQKR
jgi:hypothetical protein